jgi:hypothetical protein
MEEEFDSRAGATPRDHRIYRTVKLELKEDVEGVGWYGGRRGRNKVVDSNPLPSFFLFVCGLFVQARST